MIWLVAYILGQIAVTKWLCADVTEDDISWFSLVLVLIFIPGMLIAAYMEEE